LGGRKGIRPVKTEWWGAGMIICLERGADLHMAQLMPLPLTVSRFSKIQVGFTFLFWYRLTRIVPDRGLLNACVCVLQLVGSYPIVAKSLRDIRKSGGKPVHRQHCCGMTLQEHGLGYEDLDKLLHKPQPLEFIIGMFQ